MNHAQMGVEPPANANPAPSPAPAPAPTPTPAPASAEPKAGDTTPEKTEPGTGADPKPTPSPNPNPPAPVDDKDSRINNLMSKWQTEEHHKRVAQDELARYKATYGELPPNGNPAPTPRPANPAGGAPKGNDGDLPAALREGWQPATMAEFQAGLAEIAQYGAKMAHQSWQQQQEAVSQATQIVENFVAEVKSADPEFNDKLFFGYADKYQFPVASIDDLRRVYIAYTDHNRAVREAEQRGAQNRQDRNDPVGKPGAGAGGGNGVPFSKISQAHSAQDLIHDVLHNQK